MSSNALQPETHSNASQSERVARSAGIMSIAVFASRITGLVRERVVAHYFGGSIGVENDAFQLGFRIPNLTRDLFAEGALSSAFVPVFTEYLATKGKKEAAQLAYLVATAIIAVVGSLCALGIILSPFIVRLLAPGFLAIPGKFELAVTLTRIMFPFLLLVALVLALATIIPGWLAALIVATVVLGTGAITGYVGWMQRPRSPLTLTRKSLKEDWEWLKAQLA